MYREASTERDTAETSRKNNFILIKKILVRLKMLMNMFYVAEK